MGKTQKCMQKTSFQYFSARWRGSCPKLSKCKILVGIQFTTTLPKGAKRSEMILILGDFFLNIFLCTSYIQSCLGFARLGFALPRFCTVQLPRLSTAQCLTEAQSLWDFSYMGDIGYNSMNNHANIKKYSVLESAIH